MIPQLADYSAEQLREAGDAWPAIRRYLDQITRPVGDPADRIRVRRHDAWLRAAVATYFDSATAKDICAFWSSAAESLILEAWNAAGGDQAEICVLALGKLGAEELNLSSDVDLILVRRDGSSPDPKIVRAFQNSLSELTSFGFALRVDLTLRPGGAAAAALPSVSEFENHYGYHGEMWERLAYVRMRVLSGPAVESNEIREFSRKFSFRKHLDYTLLGELKALRAKIRHERGEKNRSQETFHLKLGNGGIRELELFVHALQVIHGGRNARLQTHSTDLAIRRIREMALLPAEDCDFLLEAYWYLRRIENRIQAFEDQQNYIVGSSHPAISDVDFSERLQTTTARVTEIASSLFDDDEAWDADLSEEYLAEKGFSAASRAETWPALLSATALSRKSESDERARMIFLRGFVNELAQHALDRDLGLSLLLDFVKAVRAKASFFTLLNRETRVRDDLAKFFSISPYLGSILASRPELIDEFIFRKQAEPSSDLNLLLEELAERRLLAELIGASQFLGDHDLRKLSFNLTANADAICSTLLETLKTEHGSRDLGLIALGKWGGRELGLRSDLDFIFISKDEPSPEDQKVARRFLSRITEPHRGGSIYAVDLRLRPSGNSGPILVSEASLRTYLDTKAAAWERQAYLRSRPIVEMTYHPAQVGAARKLDATDVAELAMIRQKLFKPPTAADLDLKLEEGGLADVEFTAQIALLARGEFSLDPSTSGMIQYLESLDEKWEAVGPSLREGYDSLRRIEQLFQLVTSHSGSKLRVKSDEFRRLALVLGLSPAELEAQSRDTLRVLREKLGEVRPPRR